MICRKSLNLAGVNYEFQIPEGLEISLPYTLGESISNRPIIVRFDKVEHPMMPPDIIVESSGGCWSSHHNYAEIITLLDHTQLGQHRCFINIIERSITFDLLNSSKCFYTFGTFGHDLYFTAYSMGEEFSILDAHLEQPTSGPRLISNSIIKDHKYKLTSPISVKTAIFRSSTGKIFLQSIHENNAENSPYIEVSGHIQIVGDIDHRFSLFSWIISHGSQPYWNRSLMEKHVNFIETVSSCITAEYELI